MKPWRLLSRILVRVLGAALVFALTDGAYAGDLIRTEFASTVLGKPYAYTIYEPSRLSHGARLPVLFLLHGAGGDETSWSRDGNIKAVADRLIAARSIRPMIIVMPAAGDCWWIDGGACRMTTLFWTELLPRVAARPDVADGRGGRAIAGTSAGGFGALHHALRHPEAFAAAALLSPAIYPAAPPDHSKARSSAAFLDEAGRFDPVRWRSASYPSVLAAYAKAQHKVALHIASGDRDAFGIALEAARLHGDLRSIQGNNVQLRITDGDHTWAYWSVAIEDALKFVSAHFETAPQEYVWGRK